MAPRHGLDRPTSVAAPATAHVAAPLPLDVVRDPDVGAVATVVHITDTGVVMDTDPNPVTVDIPMDAHISLFLRHARRCAEDTAAGSAVDIAPPDTSTEIVVGTAPGVATPMVVVGPTTDGDFGTADGALPCDDDFGPITTGDDREEVTAVAPDGTDPEPTSLDLAPTRGSDTTAAIPVGTDRMVDGVSDGGFGTDDFADEVLSDDVVDFDPHPAWGGGDDITAALPDGAHTVATAVATTGTKSRPNLRSLPVVVRRAMGRLARVFLHQTHPQRPQINPKHPQATCRGSCFAFCTLVTSRQPRSTRHTPRAFVARGK